VWLGLGVSIVCVTAILILIQRYYEYRSTFDAYFTTNNKPHIRKLNNGEQLRVKNGGAGNHYLYVFGNLLSQGYCITSTITGNKVGCYLIR